VYFSFLLLVDGVIVACNVTRNEICSQEFLVIDVLALESRWLRTFVVGEVFKCIQRYTVGLITGVPFIMSPSTVDLSHSKPDSTGKFRDSCHDQGHCNRDTKC
jgi:hypothetical protein